MKIRAKYLLAGDGGRSVIAEQLGLPFGGQANVAGSMNIVFRADLSPALVAHRPSVLYWIMSAGGAGWAASGWASCGWCAPGMSG